jgi:hypothetical protein
MKQFIFTLILILTVSIQAFSQTKCVKVDSVYSTARVRELGNRDIRFGIKQIAEDLLSNNYCLSDSGESISIEVFYFGIPKSTIRIAGIERSNQVTQVGVRLRYLGKKYEGIGESETEVTATMVELTDGIPFSKMTVSNSLKKAIEECITQMPK